jgi:hypothetical protein
MRWILAIISLALFAAIGFLYFQQKPAPYNFCAKQPYFYYYSKPGCTASSSVDSESLVVDGKSYGLSKKEIITTLVGLAAVAEEDTPEKRRSAVQDGYASRKSNFSPEGWTDYQKYLGLVTSKLQLGWDHSSWFDRASEKFSERKDGSVDFEIEAGRGERDFDLILMQPQYQLNITFTKKRDASGIIITSWKKGYTAAQVKAAQDVKDKAEGGDAEAQRKLGGMYRSGWVYDRSIGDAEKWLKMAAERGDRPAQLELGRFYADEEGAPRDLSEACFWNENARRGWAYENPLFIRDDACISLSKEERGAVQKRVAEWQSGWVAERERVKEKRLTDELAELRSKADRCDELAQYRIGLKYENGSGVPQDWAEAYFWYGLSMKCAKPREGASYYFRRAAKNLTDQQIQIESKRIEEWKPVTGKP